MTWIVDGHRGQTDAKFQNLAQLLDSLEQGEGRDQRVVTAVRFGGVADPTFREPAILARSVSEGESIEIDTSTVGALLQETAQAAYDSIPPLEAASRRVGAAFRQGDILSASREMAALVHALRTLSSLSDLLAASSSDTPEADGRQRLFERLQDMLQLLTEHQANEDWFAVGDVLERELTQTLDAWAVWLTEIGHLAQSGFGSTEPSATGSR